MQSPGVWKFHEKYKRNYKDYADENGKYWRRYDNENGPLVAIPQASIVNPVAAQQQTVRRDTRTPRSQPPVLSTSPRSTTSEALSHSLGEQYPTSNSPPNRLNLFQPTHTNPWGSQKDPTEVDRDPWGLQKDATKVDRDPWGLQKDATEVDRDPWGAQNPGMLSDPSSPKSGDLSHLSQQSSSTYSTLPSFTEDYDTIQPFSPSAQGQLSWDTTSQAPLDQSTSYEIPGSHQVPSTTIPTRSETFGDQPAPESKRILPGHAVPSHRLTARRQSSSDNQKRYHDKQGSILVSTSSSVRRKLSSSSSRSEQDVATGMGRLSLQQAPPIDEEAIDEPTLEASTQQSAKLDADDEEKGQPEPYLPNERSMPRLDENEPAQFKNRITGSSGDRERLDDRYKKRKDPRNFFKEGRVFALLWSEPHGDNGTDVSAMSGGYKTKFNQKVFSGIRRMVVVKEKKECCWCIPVTTYGQKGTSKAGIKASSHAIIYMSNSGPARLPAETGLTKDPIVVDPATPDQKLDQLSRINFAKIYTVEHNVKVMPVGMVAKKSMHLLKVYFKQEFDS